MHHRFKTPVPTIHFPTDFSDGAHATLQHDGQLARVESAELLIVHVRTVKRTRRMYCWERLPQPCSAARNVWSSPSGKNIHVSLNRGVMYV